jgi:hypothetical protein
VLCGPWQCRGAEEALGTIRLLCSDTLRVRLCRLGPASPRWAFWSLLGGEEGRLQGLTSRLGSPRAPGGRGKACLLVSRPVHDPIEGAAGKAAPKMLRRGASSPGDRGVLPCARALASIVSQAGTKGWAQVSHR